ncbi:MAG: ATP-binding protein [Nanoarchaeota archaeon]|nr:ATP-binding protein [Nanoarchaeota archaeon]
MSLIEPMKLKPKVHAAGMIKQIVRDKGHRLDMVREALSNMATPEVGAKEIKITFYEDPDCGWSFIFRDDGCGMNYDEDEENPGRLNRFIHSSMSDVAGFESDHFGAKGLGSKLMFDCRKLEIGTWDGKASSKAYKVEVIDPRDSILKEKPELPDFFIYPREPQANDRQGTEIKVSGYEGGEEHWSWDELLTYLYQYTLVGYTKKNMKFPRIILKANGKEEELYVGYRHIVNPYPQDPKKSWQTVIVDPPIEVKKSAYISGKSKDVKVTLKGGFTMCTGDPNFVTYTRHNTGVRLSVKGIPYFPLDWNRTKGKKFKQYKELCNFIVECDEMEECLNKSRSGYIAGAITDAFVRATRGAFDILANSPEYLEFEGKKRKEDEISKANLLNKRKKALNSPDQKYVYFVDNLSSPLLA